MGSGACGWEGSRCYWKQLTGKGLCVHNIRSIILCAFHILAWLGPLVSCLGFAILCILSNQMFSICLFLAVYFLLQNLTFSSIPVPLYRRMAFVCVWCHYCIRVKTFVAKGKVLCMKTEITLYLFMYLFISLHGTKNLGSLCHCQTSLDKRGRKRKERNKEGMHKGERISYKK